MIAIDIQNIKKSYGGHMVLEDLQMIIKAKARVGLIGNNGTGKTTLFKMISKEEWPDEGQIHIQKKSVVGYLNQIPEYPDKKANEVLNEAFQSIDKIKKEIKEYEEKLQLPEFMSDGKILEQYGELLSTYEIAGGYDIDEKLSKICQGFQLDENFLSKDFETLSGGEKTRLMLAKLLLEAPTVLLLDEPTNHLDIEMVQWLEEYLKNYEHTIIIISHDRYFLDAVVTEIYELRNKQADHYVGNYTAYVHERNERLKSQESQFKQQQKKIKAMNESIKRFRDWGNRVDNDKMFKKAKELEKRLEKLDKIEKPKFDDNQMNLSFEKNQNRSKEVIRIENLSFAYGEQELFNDAEAYLYKNERMVLLGPNGSGKSTLINLMSKKLQAQKGIVKVGESIKIGYMAQEIHFDNPDETILELFKDTFIYTELESRRKLAQFLFFADDVYKKVGNLSGGEKVRLSLCMMVEDAVDFLILDEPTNHVDISSREMLETALDAFKGTLMFISHDRYFINKLATKVWTINDKKIENFDGTYLELLESRKVIGTPKHKNNVKKESKPQVKKVPQKKKAVTIDYESLIQSIEDEMSDLKNLMSNSGDDYKALISLQEDIDEKQNKLDALYSEWMDG